MAQGLASPSEILNLCLARVPTAQTSGAFVLLDESGARRRARELECRTARTRQGLLHGVPVAVKDLIDVAGWPTALGRGSGRQPIKDAAIVARLRGMGAVLVGKTRTDELGLGTLTPRASDPADPMRSVGGSSGGSAIAVAVGAAVLALATDTAGSARIPAAACGVAGLCPAPRWISRQGVEPLSPSHDRLGFIAADAADIGIAWSVLSRAGGPNSPRRVLLFARAALGGVEEQHACAAEAAARELSPSPIVLTGPSFAKLGRARGVVVTAEAARFHQADRAESELARVQLRMGAGYPEAVVNRARATLDALGLRLRAAVADGVLVTPTLPGPPPRFDEVDGVHKQLRATARLTRFCGPVNSSGLVALTVPFGVDHGGRPIGIQLIARREAAVLGAAARLPSRLVGF